MNNSTIPSDCSHALYSSYDFKILRGSPSYPSCMVGSTAESGRQRRCCLWEVLWLVLCGHFGYHLLLGGHCSSYWLVMLLVVYTPGICIQHGSVVCILVFVYCMDYGWLAYWCNHNKHLLWPPMPYMSTHRNQHFTVIFWCWIAPHFFPDFHIDSDVHVAAMKTPTGHQVILCFPSSYGRGSQRSDPRQLDISSISQ